MTYAPVFIQQLVLDADTAESLMSHDPVSIEETATVKDAAALLTDREISAAPVIDSAGRPVGVVSRTDIVRYARENVVHCPTTHEFFEKPEVHLRGDPDTGFQLEITDPTPVRDIMTPTVISVPQDFPVTRVIGEMLAFKVHRLFVVDEAGVLVGVISAFDLLRRLRRN